MVCTYIYIYIATPRIFQRLRHHPAASLPGGTSPSAAPLAFIIWRFPMGVYHYQWMIDPQHGGFIWFIMEHPMKMDDLGIPPFRTHHLDHFWYARLYPCIDDSSSLGLFHGKQWWFAIIPWLYDWFQKGIPQIGWLNWCEVLHPVGQFKTTLFERYLHWARHDIYFYDSGHHILRTNQMESVDDDNYFPMYPPWWIYILLLPWHT